MASTAGTGSTEAGTAAVTTAAVEPLPRTTQLRRYTILPGELEPFVDWFTTRLIPARRAHGFCIEHAYPVPASREFVWAVSRDGDEQAFLAVEAAYNASPQRAAAFEGVPKRIERMQIDFVTSIV